MMTYFLKCKHHDTCNKQVRRVPTTKFDNCFYLILCSYDYNMSSMLGSYQRTLERSGGIPPV